MWGAAVLELFIGRRALNKIMVHADYSSAETCLPQPQQSVGRGGGGAQDYCGHVLCELGQQRFIVDLSKWSECYRDEQYESGSSVAIVCNVPLQS